MRGVFSKNYRGLNLKIVFIDWHAKKGFVFFFFIFTGKFTPRLKPSAPCVTANLTRADNFEVFLFSPQNWWHTNLPKKKNNIWEPESLSGNSNWSYAKTRLRS